METKEETLKLIKTITEWSDEQCLDWYNKQEKINGELESLPVFVAYYIQSENTGRRTYKIVLEEEFIKNKLSEKAYEYERFFNKKKANEQLSDWKKGI